MGREDKVGYNSLAADHSRREGRGSEHGSEHDSEHDSEHGSEMPPVGNLPNNAADQTESPLKSSLSDIGFVFFIPSQGEGVVVPKLERLYLGLSSSGWVKGFKKTSEIDVPFDEVPSSDSGIGAPLLDGSTGVTVSPKVFNTVNTALSGLGGDGKVTVRLILHGPPASVPFRSLTIFTAAIVGLLTATKGYYGMGTAVDLISAKMNPVLLQLIMCVAFASVFNYIKSFLDTFESIMRNLTGTTQKGVHQSLMDRGVQLGISGCSFTLKSETNDQLTVNIDDYSFPIESMSLDGTDLTPCALFGALVLGAFCALGQLAIVMLAQADNENQLNALLHCGAQVSDILSIAILCCTVIVNFSSAYRGMSEFHSKLKTLIELFQTSMEKGSYTSVIALSLNFICGCLAVLVNGLSTYSVVQSWFSFIPSQPVVDMLSAVFGVLASVGYALLNFTSSKRAIEKVFAGMMGWKEVLSIVFLAANGLGNAGLAAKSVLDTGSPEWFAALAAIIMFYYNTLLKASDVEVSIKIIRSLALESTRSSCFGAFKELSVKHFVDLEKSRAQPEEKQGDKPQPEEKQRDESQPEEKQRDESQPEEKQGDGPKVDNKGGSGSTSTIEKLYTLMLFSDPTHLRERSRRIRKGNEERRDDALSAIAAL